MADIAATETPAPGEPCPGCPPLTRQSELRSAAANAAAMHGSDWRVKGPPSSPAGGKGPPLTPSVKGRPLIIPRGGYTPSRPSCALCCEKHLGTAYVLLTETRDGYAHRLRAVGHLFEAEDESQAWPQLHNAIRDARRAYQAAGTMPDWESLAAMLAACRESPG